MHALWQKTAALAGILTLALAGTAYAEPAGVTVIEQEKPTEETSPTSWGEEKEESWYFTAEGFDAYYQSLKNRMEEDPAAACKLFLLLVGGGVDEDSIRKVMEDGYLTEYIKEFKSAGVLDVGYTLPEGVEVKETAIRSGGAAAEQSYSHDYIGISESAEKALIVFSADGEEDNSYINIPISASQTTISGSTLAFTYYNSEPFTINFLNGEGYADVSWHFANLLPLEDSVLDLKVEHDEGNVIFSLDDEAFPLPATVSVKMESPNTKYNAYGLDGAFRQTYTSDRNGYLTMEVTGGEDSVRLAKEVVTENTEQETESTAAVPVPEQTENLSMSGLQITVIIVIIAAMILFLSAYQSEYRRRK